MRFFAGINKTDYQDVLRAIGRYVDERGWRSVRLMELDDGILVQGMLSSDGGYLYLGGGVQSRVFSDADIHQILVDAYGYRDGKPLRTA